METDDQLIAQLGELLLRTRLGSWRNQRHIAKEIILELARVNMPVTSGRLLRHVKEKLPTLPNLEMVFEDTLNELARIDVVWRCLSCPATRFCEAKPLSEHNCLVEGPLVSRALMDAEPCDLSDEEQEEFASILRTVSHHGVDKNVPSCWEFETGSESDLQDSDEVFDKAILPEEMEVRTCEMLERATLSIRIASEYGGWVAKEPFRSIIASKIQDGVKVTLIVNAPPARGTNGYSEWREWHKRHQRMGISRIIKRKQAPWERGGASSNMTIIETSTGKEILFFDRDRYGTIIDHPIHSNLSAVVVEKEKEFEEFAKRMQLLKRLWHKVKPDLFIELVTGAAGATIGALGGPLWALAGFVAGVVLGFFGKWIYGRIQRILVARR
jgi:hypothetical protein